MKKYRPKKLMVFAYGVIYKTYITCYPQSKWELRYRNEEKVGLANKNTVIEISKEDFDKHWIEIGEW